MAPTAFSKTYAALLAERGRSNSLTLVATLLALGAWTWWAIKSELTLYEVSTSARVELDSATYPIQSPFVGKIVRTNLSVGKDVKLGDILVEIDSEPDQLQLRQEQVRVLGLDPALDRLRSQLTAGSVLAKMNSPLRVAPPRKLQTRSVKPNRQPSTPNSNSLAYRS
jgi:multidrug resistance efflux pump